MGRRLGACRRYMLPSAFREWMTRRGYSAKAAAHVLDVSQACVLDWRAGRSSIGCAEYVMIQAVDMIAALERVERWDDLMAVYTPMSWVALRQRMLAVRSWPVKGGRPKRVRDAA